MQSGTALSAFVGAWLVHTWLLAFLAHGRLRVVGFGALGWHLLLLQYSCKRFTEHNDCIHDVAMNRCNFHSVAWDQTFTGKYIEQHSHFQFLDGFRMIVGTFGTRWPHSSLPTLIFVHITKLTCLYLFPELVWELVLKHGFELCWNTCRNNREQLYRHSLELGLATFVY